MVTGPGWTPRGHFDLTERMSPVCAWLRLSGNWDGNQPEEVCVCVCVYVCVCVCVRVLPPKVVPLQSAQFTKALVVAAVLFLLLCWGVLFCSVSSKMTAQEKCYCNFCLLISYINSTFHLATSVFFFFICSKLLTKPAVSCSPKHLVAEETTHLTASSYHIYIRRLTGKTTKLKK